MAQLLITGGAGFIGSHTCLVLLEAGHQLLVLDDFSNSSAVALERVAELAGARLQRDQPTLIKAPERSPWWRETSGCPMPGCAVRKRQNVRPAD